MSPILPELETFFVFGHSYKGDLILKLLEVRDIKLEVNGMVLLESKHLEIYSGDRIGLIGINGSGKTTLLEELNTVSQYVSHYSTVELIPQLKDIDTVKSGGEVTLQYIQDTLSRSPHLLLLDEPTTNLDVTHIEMLDKVLQKHNGAYILVSHDREFLDRNVNQIWEIADHKIRIFKGTYSEFQEQKKQEKMHHAKEYEKYITKKAQLERAYSDKKNQAREAVMYTAANGKRKETKDFHYQKVGKKLDQVAKGIEKRIDQLEEVEQPEKELKVHLNIPNEETFLNRNIIRFNDITCSVGNRVLWHTRPFQMKGGKHIAIIGDNGVGKTTMLRMMQESNSDIEVSTSVIFGYFSQNIDILDEKMTILDSVKETSNHDETTIRTVLARLLIKRDEVNKKISVLSGGERVKVALVKVFLSNINTLILDEPTNYLDIYTMEALTELLKEYSGTVIFVSHDTKFVKDVADMIVEIKNKEVTVFDGTIEEYRAHEINKLRDTRKEDLMLIENKIAEVLGKLSIEPSESLAQEFSELLKKKRKLME